MLKGSIEENVLAMLCHSTEHASTVAMKVEVELFSTTAYRTIAEAAVDYLNEYNRPIKHHLGDVLEEVINKRDDGELINNTVNGMRDIFPEMDQDFILNQIAHFVRKRAMTAAAAKFAELVHKDKLDEAQEAIYSLDQAAPPSPGIWSHDTASMLSFMEVNEEDFFSSGIEALDVKGCRPARKTMMVLVAPAKKGKSWWIIGVGKQALMHNKKVLHITLENSEQLTARRYVQALLAMAKSDVGPIRIPQFRREVLEIRTNKREILGNVSGIDTNDLYTPSFISANTHADMVRRLNGLKTRGKLHIKEFSTGELTLAAYKQYLDYLARAHQFIPDLVAIDYPNLMSFPGKDPRLALGALFKGLRGVAVSRNHALVVVTQGNRASAEAKVVRTNMIAEDWSIVGTGDTVITYNQTYFEKQANMARLLVAAARDAEDQYMVQITQAYQMGQFCLDSAFLTRDLTKLAKSAIGADDAEEED